MPLISKIFLPSLSTCATRPPCGKPPAAEEGGTGSTQARHDALGVHGECREGVSPCTARGETPGDLAPPVHSLPWPAGDEPLSTERAGLAGGGADAKEMRGLRYSAGCALSACGMSRAPERQRGGPVYVLCHQ